MEYESFHFLVHKQVDLPPNYVKAVPESPPTFEELWMASPESLKRKTLKKDEKLFWRSRQRLEFIIEEARGKGCIVVNVREVDTNTVRHVPSCLAKLFLLSYSICYRSYSSSLSRL